MKLIYQQTDLFALGELRILGRSTRREPVEAPQRERVEYRVRLDFFEQSFQANYGLVKNLLAALNTSTAQLQWIDDGGITYENRPVTAGETSLPADVLGKGGTYWQAVEFSFWYWNHDLVTGTLNGSFTSPGFAAQDLGAIDAWSERRVYERVDIFRDQRRSGVCTITASGRWQADTTLPLAQRQAALLAKKDALITAINKTATGTLKFGTLEQLVRVSEFTPEVNQPSNFLAWKATFTFTCYPDEADYTLVELKIQRRENLQEGIKRLILTGRIQSQSETAANDKLTALAASIVPVNYIQQATDITPTIHQSNSDAGGDGEAFTEINYTLEYRDITGRACSYQRPVANAPQVDLGTVDGFGFKYVTTLFDEMRSVRKRAAGSVNLSGAWYAADSLSDAAKISQLQGQLNALKNEIVKGAAGRLIYGSAFNQVVRVMDFNPVINRERNRIEWSLTGSYTHYPNEDDYAYADIQLGTRENQADGTVIMTMTGRIGAQSPEAAQSKLSRLRSSLIPAGYLLQSNDEEEHRISSESNRTNPALPQGDGDAFIELTVNDVWQKSLGNILNYTLRTSTIKDVRSTVIRKTYSGTVRASAASQSAAFAAAAAMADSLGNNKLPLLFRSEITSLDRLFQTSGGQIFVTVEFSYEYESQNDTSYLELTSLREVNPYGLDSESIRGYIAAPSIAAAEVIYQTDVRGLAAFAGALVLSEQKPTLNQSQIIGVGTLEQRYDFSLQLFRPKTSGQSSIKYDVSPNPNFRTRELTTVVSGTVWAASQTEGEALIQTIITGLNLVDGQLMANPRTPHFRQGPALGGEAPVNIFESMDFSVTYISLFTGLSGLLECEVNEDVLYSGNRNVEKMIPDGPSIIQQAGVTCGQRTVTARCRATTDTTAQSWIRTMRSALLASQNGTGGAYEDPPRVSKRSLFLPRVTGVIAGDGANVTMVEVTGTFAEKIPELIFA